MGARLRKKDVPCVAVCMEAIPPDSQRTSASGVLKPFGRRLFQNDRFFLGALELDCLFYHVDSQHLVNVESLLDFDDVSLPRLAIENVRANLLVHTWEADDLKPLFGIIEVTVCLWNE